LQIFSPPATVTPPLAVHGLASPSHHPPATLCRLGYAAAPRAALLAGALTAHSNPLCRVSRPSPRQVFRFGGGRLAGSEVGGRPCWRLYPSTGTANRTPGTTEMAFDYEGQMASVRCIFVDEARPPLGAAQMAQRSEIIEQARHSSSRARLKGARGARAATDERLSALSGTVLAKAWSDEAHPGLYFCVRRRRARQCAACCGQGPSVGSRSVAVHFVLVSTASAHRHAVSWSGNCVT